MAARETFFETFADDLGPSKIIHLYDPRTDLKAIVVVDNVAIGPAIGGLRIAPDITTEEVFRLARAMTLKNSAAGIPHGGAKAGIIGDPHNPDKEPLIRAFARKIRTLTEYIPGPDMGTNEQCMAYIFDEIRRCVGLPRALGGVPLDEIGATALGVSEAAWLALPFIGIDPQGARLAVQGFGNVGRHSARFMAQRGVKLVAACDSTGTVHLDRGLDIEKLIEIKAKEGTVLAYPEGDRLSPEEIIGLPCDIMVPAARPDAITKANVEQVQAKLIIEGANIPVTEEAERILHDRGVLCIPDFIANAGGVICGAVEYRGGGENEALAVIREKVSQNTRQLLERLSAPELYPRQAAMHMATERVKTAMTFRKFT